jgi:N utilization substance protein A
MNLEVMSALNELEKERGITKEIILEAIEAAITSAYKRNYGTSQNVRVEVDEKTGEINVYARKIIVEDAVDETTQIGLNEAKEIDPNYQLDYSTYNHQKKLPACPREDVF